MSDDRVYKDGDIVWVKLGNNWWPGEVTDVHRQPEGLLKHLKKKPYCVVKFFQEDAYEYIKSAKQIFPFQCNKKDEFIKKGTALYNGKNKFMEKFPSDVEIAERLTRKAIASDLLIINDRPDSIVKAILGPTYTRRSNDYYDNEYNNSSCNTDYNNKRRSGDSVTKILNIIPPRTTTTTTTTIRTPESGKALTSPLITPNNTTNSNAVSSIDTNFYRCSLCNFSSQRQNLMIMHRRTHSAIGTPTAALTPARKTPSATITTAASAANVSSNAIAGTTPTPATSPKDESGFLSDDVERKYAARLGASAAYIPKSDNNAPSLNNRSASDVKNRQQPPLAEGAAASRAAAGTSRQKLRSSLRIDADITEITLPDGMPIGALKEELKLTDDDTTDNSSSPTEEKLLRTCSPRKHNMDAGESVGALVVLKSTAEEIQQRLLADWSDGEKEDEMVDECKARANRGAEPIADENECLLNKLAVETNPIKTDETIYDAATSMSAAVSNAVPQIANQNQNQNRIRNIPKKDRRDAVLKEFTSDYTVASSPAAAVNLESINCSSSNSSDSVVVVAVVPPNSGETIIVDDNTGTDGETEASETGTNGNKITARGLPLNDILVDHCIADENNEEFLWVHHKEKAVPVENRANVEEEAVEYTQKLEKHEEAQNTEIPAERLKNGDELILISGELANNKVAVTEENMQSTSDEETDLKSENGDMKPKVLMQYEKQRVRERRPKSKRTQKSAKEALIDNLEPAIAVEHVPVETEASFTHVSPQHLKEEERPLTSSAAAQQQQRTDCFDFQEEEDDSCSAALKSIADFKKKYLSPEKAQDKTQADNGGMPPESERRRSTEQKDQQLAYDIEKLLQQTTASSIVDAAIPAVVARTHSFGSSKEELPVKGLPIKERGKRIFKSRNRSRIDETSPLTGVGIGIESVAAVTMLSYIEPKTEEHVPAAMSKENQQEAHVQVIAASEHEVQVEPSKALAYAEIADGHENLQSPAATHASDVLVAYDEGAQVATIEEVGGNEANKETVVSVEFREEPAILKLKTVNNGSIGTAIGILGAASADEKKCKSEEANGEKLYKPQPEIDDEERSKQIVVGDVPKNGNDYAASKQEAEMKAVENDDAAQHDLFQNDLQGEEDHSNKIDNVTESDVVQEICSAPANLRAIENDGAAIEREYLSEEVAGNAASEVETVDKAHVAVSNEFPVTPVNNENTTETTLVAAQLSVDKVASEVAFAEQPTGVVDKELVHEVDDALAATLKNDVAEEQQHASILMGEDATQSRFASPTDDNSSICISEAGAEFGSPTSMLDDERLPTITGRVMTPTDTVMDTTPAGSEEAKILRAEQQMEVVDAAENANETQNNAEELAQTAVVFAADQEGGEMEAAQEIAANELNAEPTALAEANCADIVAECNEGVANESSKLITKIAPDSENAAKEPVKEATKNNEKMTDELEQETCVATNAAVAQSVVVDKNNTNYSEDGAASRVKVDDADVTDNDELVRMESAETPIRDHTKVIGAAKSEVPAEATLEKNENPLSERGRGVSEFVDNNIEQHVANTATEEHTQADGAQQQPDGKIVNIADVQNKEKLVLATITEHVQPDDSDMDDDFIESPPHEPLSGHEGDAERLSLRTKVLTKTQKRTAFTKSDNAVEPSDTEAHIERRTHAPAHSTKRSHEFTKAVTSSKRLTRATNQRQAKSNDYMKELDLSDLHETATQEDRVENEVAKQLKTPALQNQRKSTNATKLTEMVEETHEAVAAAAGVISIVAGTVSGAEEEFVTAPELNDCTQIAADAVPTPPLDSPRSNEAAHEAPIVETAAANAEVNALKSGGSSRKRRCAIKITPRRNAAGAQNDATKESTLTDQDESIQRAKCRKVESSEDGSISVETIQAAEELNAPVEMSSADDAAFDSLIEEVDPAEMDIEENDGANNTDSTSLVVDAEQCIIEEVYLNDTMSLQQIAIETSENDNGAIIENAEDSAASELNSIRPHDASNAVEYVDYSSIEQPLEEVIVGDVNTVEAPTDSEPLQPLQNSPNNASAALNQRRSSTRDAQPKPDNVGINISPMEKVRINVDVANPLSTQIANILATKSAAGTASKKSNLEESIPSFIIERPGQGVGSHQPQQQHTSAVAHVQQMCPQVKITRKEKFIEEPTAAGVVQQEAIVATSSAMFDISNMPIVLGNEHFMSAQGDMQIVLTSSTDSETHLRTDGPQILQQQILQPAYRTPVQGAQQQQRKRSTNQQQEQQQQQQQQGSSANCQMGGNKHGIIIIKAAPSDLIIQQSQSPSLQQSQAIGGGAAQQLPTSPTDTTTKYNLGSGVTLRPIAEPKQKQQQREQQQLQQQQQQQHQQKQQMPANKPKSPAASATGGRKQAGNTITLPSSITVKQRQQKVSDCLSNAAVTTTPAEQQLPTHAASVSGNKAQKRSHPSNPRRSQSQSQMLHQRRLTATASSVAELQQQEQQLVDGAATLLNRRLSYTEAHAPPLAKISRIADNHSNSTFAATAEQQLLQLQQQQQQLQQQRQKVQSPTTSVPTTTTSQPPPLHPLQNRKQRLSSQQHRRMSTKAESSMSLAQATAQEQQQQQQRLQPTQMVLLEQQQNQCIDEQQQQAHEEQQATAVRLAELTASSSSDEIVPAEFEAVQLQAQAPELYTEEILAEEFEANEHTPSVIAVPSQPVPGYPDTLLLCRRVDEEWVPVVAQPFFYTGSDQQLRPIPKEVLIGHPILTPSTDKTTEFPIETDELQMVSANETYKEETGVTILIGNNYVHMEWDQFLEVMRSNEDVYNLRDENGHVFQLTRDALVALQQDANLQDKYRQLQQLLEEQQLEEQQQMEQQELLQQQFIQQLQTVGVTGEDGLETDIIPLLHIDTTQTLQLIGTDDGSIILQPALVHPPLSPPCTRPALTNATNALLNQTPIMSPLEKPSTTLLAHSTGQHLNLATGTTPDHLVAAGFLAADAANDMPACRPSLGDSLAVIGVVPTQSTLLPTTVTNPAIAPPKSDLIPNMTTAAQMHAQYRHAQRAIYNDPGS